MNSTSSVKQKNNVDSPKTPGGISRSLLTPCRRVGLSRKVNKKGPSPFISPLSSNNNNSEITVNIEPKKRKISTSDDETEDLSKSNQNSVLSTPILKVSQSTSNNMNSTPSRNIPLSRTKSKKNLMMQSEENTENNAYKTENLSNAVTSINTPSNKDKPISKLSRSNSKKKIEPDVEKPLQINSNDSVDTGRGIEYCSIPTDCPVTKVVKEKSPNNLTKECVVVIQKKMLKNIMSNEKSDQNTVNKNVKSKSISQTLFDSDSDDLPLCELNKKDNITKIEDNTFVDNNILKKIKVKNTLSESRPQIKNRNTKQIKPKTIEIKAPNSFDDDDDFECVQKRTILLKKSYDKVKLTKAKSTGSITQKDIDELKARIDLKKKLLIAKAMTEDTEELRTLIKKWQTGCQEALFGLFDIMKKKFPDNRNMDYVEIMQMLKIPPELVGYDVDNDCFITPDDSNIVLSSINT